MNSYIQGLPQFQAYVNRYGPGLVIYWLGFVDELNTHPQVMLMDSFPAAGDIRTLPALPLPPPPPPLPPPGEPEQARQGARA